MQSTPAKVLLELAVGVSGEGGASRDAVDGQMTNSTIREGMEGFWEARKSRAAIATVGEASSMQSSSGRPNFC